MSRTIAQIQNRDGFPKAGELIEFRSQQELSLQDRRILNLLIEHAGPNIVNENEHRISMAALRGRHKGNERVRDSIVCLMTAIVEIPVRDSNGKWATRRGQFLADTTATDDEDDPNGEVRYSFSKTMRKVIAVCAGICRSANRNWVSRIFGNYSAFRRANSSCLRT
jgi:hypothetical protein